MVYDYGEADDRMFLVMELLEGETLAHRLRDGALPPPEAATILAEVSALRVAGGPAGLRGRMTLVEGPGGWLVDGPVGHERGPSSDGDRDRGDRGDEGDEGDDEDG